jgi:hypothetical protein
MRIRLTLSLAVAALVTFPLGALAQEYEEAKPSMLSAVSTWEINPADLGKFMTAAEQVVKAAREAELDREWAWTMWQNAYTITIVGQFNKAELDDPEVWMKQFMGTPGEATLMEAFQEMEGIGIVRATNEIHQDMPAWGYMPEGMGEPPLAWVHVHEFWLKSGQANYQKWNALIGDFMAFFKDVGYAYPVWGSMVRYGDSRTIFVTAYDNPSEYHGAKGVEALAKQHMAGDRWQELLGRLAQLTNRADDAHLQFLPAQSYMGGSQETSSK